MELETAATSATATDVSRIDEPAVAAVNSVAATGSAWQQVTWYDVVNLWLTYDTTQIYWTYNGSTVSNGSVGVHVGWRVGTGWKNLYYGRNDEYGPGSVFYKGITFSPFKNSTFCVGLPTVYTYYYHNTMWGHYNGTATRDQSSDSIDECLPFHFDIKSQYGTWPGQP